MFKLIELHSAADKPDEPYVTWQLVKVSGFLFFSFHYAHQRQCKQQCGEGRVFFYEFWQMVFTFKESVTKQTLALPYSMEEAVSQQLEPEVFPPIPHSPHLHSPTELHWLLEKR